MQVHRKFTQISRKKLDTLNKHPSKKMKTFQGNQKSHVNKALREAIMKRSQLRNKANKTQNKTCFKL